MKDEKTKFWVVFGLQIILFFTALPLIILLAVRGLDMAAGTTANQMLTGPWKIYGFLAAYGLGSIWMFWSVYWVFIHGQGTPLEVAGKAVKQTEYLLRTGPYRWVRNPMAFGFVLMFVIGFGLLLGSWMTIPWTIFSFVGLPIYLRTWEEKGLVKRFGQAYIDYRKEVRAVLPRLTPLPIDPNERRRNLPPKTPWAIALMGAVWAVTFAFIVRDWSLITAAGTSPGINLVEWLPLLGYSTLYGLNIGLTVFACGGLPDDIAGRVKMKAELAA